MANVCFSIRAFQPREQDVWEEAGFYAIAYEWNNETVISYRGPNFPDLSNVTEQAFDAFYADPSARNAHVTC